MPLEVGIDVTAILNKIPRGIGSYISELISHMEEVRFTGLYKISRLKYPSRLKRLKWVSYPFFEVGGKAFFPVKFDLFHGTDGYIPKGDFKTVLTVHDVYPLIRAPESRTAKKLERAIDRRPDRIIVISNFARKEFLRFFPEMEERTHVVYNGVSDFWRKLDANQCLEVREKYHLRRPFFIYVGDTEKRKNVENLLLAFSRIKKDVELLLIGGNLNENQRKIVEKSGLNDRVRELGYITKEELRCLYNLSTAMVFVSLYEGFGLPMLEAMKCGTPVVASNIEVFKEIGGNAFLSVKPEDPVSISEGLEKILNDGALRETLVSRGLENAKRFSWYQTAVETRKVYNLALNYGKA